MPLAISAGAHGATTAITDAPSRGASVHVGFAAIPASRSRKVLHPHSAHDASAPRSFAFCGCQKYEMPLQHLP